MAATIAHALGISAEQFTSEAADILVQHLARHRIRHSAPVLEGEVVEPIPMLLWCPQCHQQHIDEPEHVLAWTGGSAPEPSHDEVVWDNPPHRSHLCHSCGCIWRPADVPTNGVAAIQTKGKADTFTAALSPSPTSQVQDADTGLIGRAVEHLRKLSAKHVGYGMSWHSDRFGQAELNLYGPNAQAGHWLFENGARIADALASRPDHPDTAVGELVEAAQAVMDAYEGPSALSLEHDRQEIDRRFMALKKVLSQPNAGVAR